MICAKCGQLMKIRTHHDKRVSKNSEALNTNLRTRHCINHHVIKTHEIEAGELSELRRRSFLWELHEARERNAGGEG